MNASRWLLAIILTTAASSSLADPLANDSRPSPDGHWMVSWHCKRTWQPDSCTGTLLRQADGRAFFTRQTNDRYITAAWNSRSTKCLVLDAPDNASSYFWLVRVRSGRAAVERLDYETITREIEHEIPRARTPRNALSRSGIEKITWISDSRLRLYIIYNTVPVVALLDLAQRTPAIHIVANKA
jgi:hypothetical protein